MRAGVAVRNVLMAQALESLLWRALKGARGKIRGAKLSSVNQLIGLAFDRLRLLREQNSGQGQELAPAQVDLSRLSAEELRQLAAIMAKAGGEMGGPGAAGGVGVPEGPPQQDAPDLSGSAKSNDSGLASLSDDQTESTSHEGPLALE